MAGTCTPEKIREGGAGLKLSAVLTFFLLGKKGESPCEGGWLLPKVRAMSCGAVSHFRCSKPHSNTSAEAIS